MPFISTIGGGSAQGFGRGPSGKIEEYFTQYDYTGGDQQFNIPSGLTEVEAYIYGPGGGAGTQYGSVGGAGGFTYGKIDTSGGGTLDIIVGQGGSPGSQNNGSGGGYSGVFQSSCGWFLLIICYIRPVASGPLLFYPLSSRLITGQF